MPRESYQPRIAIDVTPLQLSKMQELLRWGTRNALLSAIIDDVIEMLEEHGSLAVALILDKQIKPRECVRTLKEMEDAINKTVGRTSKPSE